MTHKVTLIPGDGIGPEVTRAVVRILEATGVKFEWDEYAAGADAFEKHGEYVPKALYESIERNKLALKGPVTTPVGGGFTSINVALRKKFELYVNFRPIKNLPGLETRYPGVDLIIVRENTEGEYSSVGGVMFEGTEREFVLQESVFTRHGSERVLKFAFDLAQRRERKKITVATKSNGIAISMPWWDKCAAGIAAQYPDVAWDKQHIDILCARFVLNPDRFDVVVATNLFGDILSDLGPACTGTIGLAPSANMNPDRKFPSLFEPVHGSAPDIFGKNIANPIAMVWSAAMMLDFLGNGQGVEREAHDAMLAAIEAVLKDGPRTGDLGGRANTTEVGKAIAERLA